MMKDRMRKKTLSNSSSRELAFDFKSLILKTRDVHSNIESFRHMNFDSNGVLERKVAGIKNVLKVSELGLDSIFLGKEAGEAETRSHA